MKKRDYYEVLCVEHSADEGAIKSAYRRCAMEHHPDRNPGDHQAEERFKEAAEAYEVLSHPEKRALYDQYGHAGAQRGGFGGFSGVEDIFSHFADIFGGDMFGFNFNGNGQGQHAARGADLQAHIKLTFLEAMKGCKKELTFDRSTPCEDCHGSGGKAGASPETCRTCGGHGQVVQSMGFMRIASTCPSCHGQGRMVREKCPACRGAGVTQRKTTVTIDVPPGIDEGRTLRLRGQGAQSPSGDAGNLYVEFTIAKDPRFERDGGDLLTEVPITFSQAALGCRVKVPTIDDSTTVDIPAGTLSGTIFTLRRMGAPLLDSNGRGDLHVRINVVIPKKLTEEQRRLIQELAALDEPLENALPPEAEHHGFFRRHKKK